jgi:hypothetical protein
VNSPASGAFWARAVVNVCRPLSPFNLSSSRFAAPLPSIASWIGWIKLGTFVCQPVAHPL